MDSSVSGKDEFWFLRVCHHVPHELYMQLVQMAGMSGTVWHSAMPTEQLTYVVWQVGLLVQPVPEVHQVLLYHLRVLLDLLVHALQLIRRWSLQCHGVATCTHTHTQTHMRTMTADPHIMSNSCYCRLFCRSALQ